MFDEMLALEIFECGIIRQKHMMMSVIVLVWLMLIFVDG